MKTEDEIFLMLEGPNICIYGMILVAGVKKLLELMVQSLLNKWKKSVQELKSETIKYYEVMEKKITYVTSKDQIMFTEFVVFKVLAIEVINFAHSLIDKMNFSMLGEPKKSREISYIIDNIIWLDFCCRNKQDTEIDGLFVK